MPPKSKDPNKPKGRTNAYAFYLKDKRAESKSKGEEVQFTEFSRQCGDDWKHLDAKQKKKFNALAEKDKVRYDREMKDYVPPDGVGKGAKGKDPNMPKRSLSGFMFFCQAKRPELRKKQPSATVGELAKQLGAAWKRLKEDQKVPFEEKAKEDRARYDRDMKEYKSKKATVQDEEEEEEEESEED